MTLFDLRDERLACRARRRLPWLRMTAVFRACASRLLPTWLSMSDVGSWHPGPSDRSGHGADRSAARPGRPSNPANSAFGLDKALGPAIVEARQHSGGGREDTLIVGALRRASLCPYRVEPSRCRPAPAASMSIWCAAPPRRASRWSATARAGHARDEVRTVEVGAADPRGHGRAGLPGVPLSANPEPAFGFQGWLCGAWTPDDAPACFIDGIGSGLRSSTAADPL